jgi:hypothetical protein
MLMAKRTAKRKTRKKPQTKTKAKAKRKIRSATKLAARSPASKRPKGGKARPGFDLGGVAPEDREGVHNTIPGGPRSGPAPGGTAQKGRGGSASGGGPTDGT